MISNRKLSNQLVSCNKLTNPAEFSGLWLLPPWWRHPCQLSPCHRFHSKQTSTSSAASLKTYLYQFSAWSVNFYFCQPDDVIPVNCHLVIVFTQNKHHHRVQRHLKLTCTIFQLNPSTSIFVTLMTSPLSTDILSPFQTKWTSPACLATPKTYLYQISA